MTCPEHAAAAEIAARALEEDLGAAGDVTSRALISEEATAVALVVGRATGVVAGVMAAEAVFAAVDADLAVHWNRSDGQVSEPGAVIGEVSGSLRSILAAERTALNLLGRLSGVATLTRRFVDAAAGVTILDTRKTTPGLRVLEKAAVRAGGGTNHRMGLFDAVLAKDNHLAHVAPAEAVARAREQCPGLLIEIECDTLEQASEAAAAGADRLLLDNMSPAQVTEAVRLVEGRCEIEVSGGVALDNVAAYAAAGPQYISVGALTHSAPALDLSLETRP